MSYKVSVVAFALEYILHSYIKVDIYVLGGGIVNLSLVGFNELLYVKLYISLFKVKFTTL